MSSLRMLHFAKARSSSTEADRPESEGQPSTTDRHSLLKSTLSSANALRGLNIDFRNSHMDLQSSLQLTSVLLVAGSQPKLKYLCLQSLATTQGILSKALRKWGRQLKKVEFGKLCLTDVEGEGRLEVLKTLTDMPRLRGVRLRNVYAMRNCIAITSISDTLRKVVS